MYLFMTTRFKIFLLVFFGLAMASIFAGCAPGKEVGQKIAKAHERNDGPALWKVTDRNSTLYLFGSVHLLPEGSDWQKRDLQAAFDEVGTLFFEIPDTDKANLEASILQRRYGVYESGDQLSNHLDSVSQKHFTAAAYNAGLAPHKLQSFKPWLVSDILAIATAEAGGLFARNSADSTIREKAKQARKVIKHLDTMRSYIEAVALLPELVQLEELRESVKNFPTFSDDIKTVNAAWIIGDLETLERELLTPAQSKSPEVYAALFTQRNVKWSQSLDVFMKGDENGLVVVGIGHMLGDDGLPARLREFGYDVERVRRYDLPNN